jgi:3-oxoacyl-[acyl-carrier protein] reductase
MSSEEAAKAVEAELCALGVTAKAIRSDAAKLDEAEKLIEDITAEFGALHIVVNNAGITRDNLLMRMKKRIGMR